MCVHFQALIEMEIRRQRNYSGGGGPRLVQLGAPQSVERKRKKCLRRVREGRVNGIGLTWNRGLTPPRQRSSWNIIDDPFPRITSVNLKAQIGSDRGRKHRNLEYPKRARPLGPAAGLSREGPSVRYTRWRQRPSVDGQASRTAW